MSKDVIIMCGVLGGIVYIFCVCRIIYGLTEKLRKRGKTPNLCQRYMWSLLICVTALLWPALVVLVLVTLPFAFIIIQLAAPFPKTEANSNDEERPGPSHIELDIARPPPVHDHQDSTQHADAPSYADPPPSYTPSA